jgi:hypothetical protein
MFECDEKGCDSEFKTLRGLHVHETAVHKKGRKSNSKRLSNSGLYVVLKNGGELHSEFFFTVQEAKDWVEDESSPEDDPGFKWTIHLIGPEVASAHAVSSLEWD